MSDDQVRLSEKLRQVLERIGVSQNMRTMYRDTSFYSEIMWTITYKTISYPSSEYRFGSSCEGTTTPGMGSDIDIVTCHEDLHVIADIREAPLGEAFLMLPSTNTGFVKLQRVLDGNPLTIHNHDIDCHDDRFDDEGRVCLKHMTYLASHKLVEEMNGPAFTVTNDPPGSPRDYVPALRSKTFPQIAADALQKCVACGWMSKHEVERLKRLGVLFVGVGCQNSPEREIEWRISFSLQERDLMLALNPTQHMCYVMLKTVKNIITSHPDVGKSLTSYHCKTCVLTVITETRPALWTENNLINCICLCLSTLKSWIYRGHCQNFFINQSNMFDREEFRQARERLLYYMREALHEWPGLLYTIEADRLGNTLQDPTDNQIDKNRIDQVYGILYRSSELTSRCQNNIIEHCHNLPSNRDVTWYLVQQLRYIGSIDTVTEHTREESQQALHRMKLFMHKLLAQHLGSTAVSTDDPAYRSRLLKIVKSLLKQGKTCDLMPGNLLDASICYRMGNIKGCLGVLSQLESYITDSMPGAVVSLCLCYQKLYHRVDQLWGLVSAGYIDVENIMECAVAPCMVFLPSQSEIIPKALQYEMYRSVYASSEYSGRHFMKWFDYCVVDTKIYLHFLQYLVYSNLDRPVAQQDAINKILETFDTDRNLCHRETAYNLLGWIYIQQGRVQEAVRCLCWSWEIRPDHNAAKWHMGTLLVRLCGQPCLL